MQLVLATFCAHFFALSQLIHDAWHSEGLHCESYMMQLLHLIMQEGGNVNYRHIQSGITPLMVAAAKGLDADVRRLLRLNADTSLTCPANE